MFCAIGQWGMVPDTVDYGEWKTGIRSEAIPFAFFQFTQKVGMGVAGAVVGWVFSAINYDSDLIVLVAPIWNYRMPAIVEGWIDKVLAPPWAFSFKKLFGNYGYAVGKLKSKKALIFCTYGSPRFSISDFFLNLPLRRIKKGIFNKCGIYDITYKRYFAVPFVSNEKRIEFLEDVKNTARHL